MPAGGDGGRGVHVHDLPEPILATVFALVSDVRTRNAMALVCGRWQRLERATRTSLALRGNARDLYLLPTCFPAVTHLDLSLLSPWGHSFLRRSDLPLHDDLFLDDASDDVYDDHRERPPSDLIAWRLRHAFPNVISLVVYSRTPTTLRALASRWGGAIRRAKVVRWHQRPHQPPGADLEPLLAACPTLTSLDLSEFYCWTEDIKPALQACPIAAKSLTRLDLLGATSTDGFKFEELRDIADACPNLRNLRAPVVFNPRYVGFVDDKALLGLATKCPRLSLIHLADPATLSPAVAPPPELDAEGFAPLDARVTARGLGSLFAALPFLEDLALDLCQNVRDAGPALEALSHKCPKIKSLKLACFHGVCRAAGDHLDGVSVCGGLESLCIKNSADLTDASLVLVGRGCQRLSKFDIQGCKRVTPVGIKKLAQMLPSTLVDVRISGCEQLDAAGSLRALEPIRSRIARLHIDCIWAKPVPQELPESSEKSDDDDASNELRRPEDDLDLNNGGGEDRGSSKSKKCRYSKAEDQLDFPADMDHWNNGDIGFRCKTWSRLQYLSLWLPAGELLTPLPDNGLESCPELEEICIKVEGDCRVCPKPTQRVFGLSTLALYPRLSKMKLDCGEAIGYALTAPTGQMDLSLWERFYLHGIGELPLYELDYWPPQDKEVNQRTLSLPATGLIQGCSTLRKLFIHGTAHEHFMRFFLAMQNLRDVQLREDYYPAPENDMSTEMRVDSCSRFEDALNRRVISD